MFAFVCENGPKLSHRKLQELKCTKIGAKDRKDAEEEKDGDGSDTNGGTKKD